ncbi:MAG: XRE family transcriptional regulator [Planctomycetes bacterium]|nr:XRE family transcriptional regulator [Planctomycetota bacterium]
MTKARKNPHLGSRFSDFLDEEGIRESVETEAIKRVIALQIADAMKKKHISKSTLAKRMHTSRTMVDRVLDPTRESTLGSLAMAASAVGKHLRVELVG